MTQQNRLGSAFVPYLPMCSQISELKRAPRIEWKTLVKSIVDDLTPPFIRKCFHKILKSLKNA